MKKSFFIFFIAFQILLCQNKNDTLPKLTITNTNFKQSNFSDKRNLNYDLKFLSYKYFSEHMYDDVLLKLNFPGEYTTGANDDELTSYLKNKLELKNLLAVCFEGKRYPVLEKIQNVLRLSNYITAVLLILIHMVKYK